MEFTSDAKYDARSNRMVRLFKWESGGTWVAYKHSDGQWVSLREATDADMTFFNGASINDTPQKVSQLRENIANIISDAAKKLPEIWANNSRKETIDRYYFVDKLAELFDKERDSLRTKLEIAEKKAALAEKGLRDTRNNILDIRTDLSLLSIGKLKGQLGETADIATRTLKELEE